MATPEENVDEKLVAKTKEMFSIFDKDQDGVIVTKDVGAVLRSVGFNPSDAQVEEFSALCDPNNEGTVDFTTFLSRVLKFHREGDSETEVIEAFRVFDPSRTGRISATVLRQVLISLGEQLSEDEADRMLAFADIDRKGNIRYMDLVKSLLSD